MVFGDLRGWIDHLREQGELIAAGLRFPKSLVTTAKNPAGKVQTVTVTVEKITVNEVFPVSFFAVPIISPQK